jgi:hypothetical protein
MKKMPALLEQGKNNLKSPVKLYARLAISAAHAIDGLLKDSLSSLASQARPGDLAASDRQALATARDSALAALHAYAGWLQDRLDGMVEFEPMGEANYNDYLRKVYLLPFDAGQVEMLGQVELARARAMEALLPDPSLASPDPSRSAHVPENQEAFLAAYESRQAEMIAFIRSHHLVTLPAYLGPFQIRQLPEAFKPTSPGGFMNPPGMYDKDSGGFFFIPTYNPKSGVGALHGGGPAADRPLSWRFRSLRPGAPSDALPRGAHRRRRQPAHREVELRAGGAVLHGGRRARPRGGRRRGGRRRLRADAEDHLHGGEVADPPAARPLP